MNEFVKKIKMRRNLLIILGVVLACLLISIPLVNMASIQTIEIQPGESKTIEVKQKKKFKVKVDGKKVSMSTSDTSVAPIKKNVIHTNNIGVATISIFGSGVQAELKLIVKKNLNDPNPVMEDTYYESVDETQVTGTDVQPDVYSQPVPVGTEAQEPAQTEMTTQNTGSATESVQTAQEQSAQSVVTMLAVTDQQTDPTMQTVQNPDGTQQTRVELSATNGTVEKKGYDLSDRLWDDEVDLPNLIYIIGAVESGGQVYGNRDYGCYIEPETNSKKETTITIGWPQFYGNNARDLLKKIYKTDKDMFLSIDRRKSVKKMLKKNWEKKKWKPNEAQKKIIIELITSKVGKECQDAMFLEEMVEYVKYCKERFTDNAWAIHMYCEIAHLGGEKNARRIFKACKGNYTLENIMAVLKEDQNNKKENEVGDEVYWDRHEVCCDFLQRNCV